MVEYAIGWLYYIMLLSNNILYYIHPTSQQIIFLYYLSQGGQEVNDARREDIACYQVCVCSVYKEQIKSQSKQIWIIKEKENGSQPITNLSQTIIYRRWT